MNPTVGDKHSVGQLRNDVDSIDDKVGTLKLDQLIDLLHAK